MGAAAVTGLSTSQLPVVILYVFAVALGIQSMRRDPGGTRVGPFLIVPFLLGLALTLFLLLQYSDVTTSAAGRLTRPRAIVLVIVVLVFALALIDWLLIRGAPVAERVISRVPLTSRLRMDASMSAVLIPLLAVGVVGMRGLERVGDTTAAGTVVRVRYDLPGRPLDIAWIDEARGYLSLGDGRIVHFSLDAGDISLREVADDLAFPRGMEIVGDRLFVAELHDLPCSPSFPECKAYNLPDGSLEEGEMRILKSASGRVVAFAIGRNGALSNRKPVLEDLPVVSSEHAVNGLEAGADGSLYVSIGNVDNLWRSPSRVQGIAGLRSSLLGAVLRLEPGGGSSIFARGLRNVYELDFGPDGHLFGVDNDGPTLEGWRGEELIEIHKGADYGYPSEGTYGGYEKRTHPPLWVLDAVGSGGLEWVDLPGLGKGVLTGSCGKIEFVRLREYSEGYAVKYRDDITRFMDMQGYDCVTSIEASPKGLLAVTTFNSTLYILDPRP